MHQELLSLLSGNMSQNFASRLNQNPASIPDMIDQMENSNPVIAWRAGWVMEKLADIEPRLLIPYHLRLVTILKKTKVNGLRRHLTRILGSYPSKACEDGELVDLCLEWIYLPKIPVAVKANAMTLMLELCKIYPDLRPELKLAIESGFDSATPGYKSRAKKILQYL